MIDFAHRVLLLPSNFSCILKIIYESQILNYLILVREPNTGRAELRSKPLPTEFELELWRPSMTQIKPAELPWFPFAFWWIFHVFHIFINDRYALVLIRMRGQLVHRSCVFPGYFRFPFMSAADLQVGDIWTSPEMRHKGLAAYALASIINSHATNTRIWYLTTKENAVSIKLAEKCEFKAYAWGKRRNQISSSWIAEFDISSSPPPSGISVGSTHADSGSDCAADQYLECTEVIGEAVSKEQLERMSRRYFWAGHYCLGKDVLEVACGTGQGLGYLNSVAKSLQAGDISPAMVKIAQTHAPNNVPIKIMDAQNLPLDEQSIDIVILFEAIYYLSDPSLFVAECKRILRPNGKILISTANKNLFDFTPSPYSYHYFCAIELADFFSKHGFTVKVFGDTRLQTIGFRQKFLRPIKKIATKLNLIPKSMASKRILKRIIFGEMVQMPTQIVPQKKDWINPDPLPLDQLALEHKVIFCEATLVNQSLEKTS